MSKKIGNKYLEKKRWNSETGKTRTGHFEMIEKVAKKKLKIIKRKDNDNWNCAKRIGRNIEN